MNTRRRTARRNEGNRAKPRPALDSRITWPDDLPIVAEREAIIEALRAHSVIIVCGETGSGKSTQLPKICLAAGRGRTGLIGHTQPRRIAARSIAGRIAEELETELGGVVGYSVRFTDRTSADTYVKVMTDGILLAETQRDRRLERYDTIIIDEAHERSLNIDFLLGYLKQLLPQRPDLKVIVTSATIDPARLSAHFDEAPVIEVEGRTYPVEVRYEPVRDDADERDRDMQSAITRAVDELSTAGEGDVLVFLSGEREIRDTARSLRRHHPPQTEILPLYARLSAAEQHRVFEPHDGRRIVLATNVAETSLTVPGIRFVVDTGFARISRYSARSKVQRLPVEPISRASARQRSGRCGRLGPGVCIRLYDEKQFSLREAFTPPEILRTNLASVILRMAALGLGDVAAFPFVEAPRRAMIRDGYDTLHELGAIDARDRLTPLGRRLARLPIDPRLGRMILASTEENCLAEVLVIAAALAVQDPRERPSDRADAADEAHRRFAGQNSDFLSYLELWRVYHEQKEALSWNKLRQWCKSHFISFVRMREWVDVYSQLRGLMRESGTRANTEPAASDAIHRALLTGLLANVGRQEENREFVGPRGARFHVFPGSGQFRKPPKWAMAAEVVETTRRYARCVARIQPSWIEKAGAHLVKRAYAEPHWDAKRQNIVATERVTLLGLEIAVRRGVPYGPVDPTGAREIFIHHALVEGELRSDAPFFRNNRAIVEALRAVESKRRKRDVLVETGEHYAFYDARLPARIWSRRGLDEWRVKAERENARVLFMSRDQLSQSGADGADARAYPAALAIDGVDLPLIYRHEPGASDDGVTVTVPLPLLGRLASGRLEWLVPAMLEEKLTALIRSLPKSLRTNFVPAPDFARACAERLEFGNGLITERMAETLQTLTGVAVPADAWGLDELPAHLRMRISVVDDSGAEVDADRDVEALRRRLGSSVRRSFARLADSDLEQTGLTDWTFGDLPESVELSRGGAALPAFPALVDQGETVAIRLLESAAAARATTRGGLRRLFHLQCREELAFQIEHLPQLESLQLAYSPFGSGAELRAVLELLSTERAHDVDGPPVRTEAEFRRRQEGARSQLGQSAYDAAELVESILAAGRTAQAALEDARRPVWSDIVDDAAAHLESLLGPSFLAETSYDQLEHFPRYLAGIARRMEKLAGGGDRRDRGHLATIAECRDRYLARRADHEARSIHDPALTTYRWMLEEFRVSCFAQELGTPVRISEKRLDEQWSRVHA